MNKHYHALGVAAILLGATVAAPAYAENHGLRPGPSHGAPAPEIAASTLGLLLAGGIAWYVRRRRPQPTALDQDAARRTR